MFLMSDIVRFIKRFNTHILSTACVAVLCRLNCITTSDRTCSRRAVVQTTSQLQVDRYSNFQSQCTRADYIQNV